MVHNNSLTTSIYYDQQVFNNTCPQILDHGGSDKQLQTLKLATSRN
jgi:hypothetical protein